MTALPLLRVKTQHSEYVIDQNNGTYTRTPQHERAADLSYAGHVAGEPREYTKVLSGLEPGEPLIIVEPDGSWVRSTLVASVEVLAPVPALVAA